MTKPQLVAFAISLLVVSTPVVMAQASARPAPCVIWHRFVPGPIVNGHRRQPTPSEVEARLRELQALSKMNAGACSTMPHSAKAIALRPPSPSLTDQVVESDLPSMRGTQRTWQITRGLAASRAPAANS
jgi:hypothetical protein